MTYTADVISLEIESHQTAGGDSQVEVQDDKARALFQVGRRRGFPKACYRKLQQKEATIVKKRLQV